MPIRDAQKRDGAQTKIGYLWIGESVGVRVLDIFCELHK